MNILHQRIPINGDGEYLLKLSEIVNMHNSIKNALPEDCIVITSPTDIIKIDGDYKIIHIDCKKYSYNELMEIIEKAEMYDGLCK